VAFEIDGGAGGEHPSRDHEDVVAWRNTHVAGVTLLRIAQLLPVPAACGGLQPNRTEWR
jgi:hypothetical protein